MRPVGEDLGLDLGVQTPSLLCVTSWGLFKQFEAIFSPFQVISGNFKVILGGFGCPLPKKKRAIINKKGCGFHTYLNHVVLIGLSFKRSAEESPHP